MEREWDETDDVYMDTIHAQVCSVDRDADHEFDLGHLYCHVWLEQGQLVFIAYDKETHIESNVPNNLYGDLIFNLQYFVNSLDSDMFKRPSSAYDGYGYETTEVVIV